jgi:hypothetical protein
MKMNFLEGLFLVFLALKLCKVVSWSWWIVTLPLWGGFTLFGIVAVAAFMWGNKK